MSKKVICLLCGGQSTEHQISLLSAANVSAAIPRDKYQVLTVGIDRDGEWHWYEDGNFAVNGNDPVNVALAPGGKSVFPMRLNGKCVLALPGGGGEPVEFHVLFPVLHGMNGEDGAVQGLAQLLGCPCVGCGMTSSALCMDKDFTKRILEYGGIKTAPWIAISKGDEVPGGQETAEKLGLPLFVKPANAGSSVGVVKVKSPEDFAPAVAEAMKFDSKILVEKAITGREIECAVLGNSRPFIAVPGEIVPRQEFYSYDAKYTMDDGADLVAPAPLAPEVDARIREAAAKAYKLLGCKGMSRVDFFLTPSSEIILNEINTIPGFTRISMYPTLMGLSGIAYSELVERLISSALDNIL